MDTKEDVWVGQMQPTPAVTNIITYSLKDDEILVKYALDGSTVCVISHTFVLLI
jgi:hypothetical protein